MNFTVSLIISLLCILFFLPQLLLMLHPMFKSFQKRRKAGIIALFIGSWILNIAHVAVYIGGESFIEVTDWVKAAFALYLGVAVVAPAFALVFFRKDNAMRIYGCCIASFFFLCFTAMVVSYITPGFNPALSLTEKILFALCMLLPQLVNALPYIIVPRGTVLASEDKK